MKKTPLNYQVVASYSRDELVEMVNSILSGPGDWVCLGAPFNENNTTRLYQALVRRTST